MSLSLSVYSKKPSATLAKKKVSKFSIPGVKQIVSRFSIRQKIGFGFGLAIGVVILGTATGRVVENFYWQQAREQLVKINEEGELLIELQRTLLQIHNSEQLLATQKNKSQLKVNAYELLSYTSTVDRILDKMKWAPKKEKTDEKLTSLLQSFSDALQTYNRELKALLLTTERANLSPEQIQAVQRSLVAFPHSLAGQNLDRLSNQLHELAYQVERKEANFYQEMNGAQQLETLIVFGSLLASAAIAAAIAIHISGAIALPVKMTTAVAQRVTKTSNFDLHAPVTTDDEIGHLANSLNQLIQRVKEHTQELQATHTQLIQAEKMSSLGSMVAGIAHEINNPVTFIYGNLEPANDYIQDLLKILQIYQKQFPQLSPELQAEIDALEPELIAEDLPKILASMKIGTERIRQLVLSLRNFSRLDEAEVKKADLHEGIDSTLLILSHRLKNGITVIKDYGNLPPVDCYPAQLNQVFMNVLSNAIDALQDRKEQSKKQITIQTRLVAPDRVQVQIRDNGPGISPEIKKKIFDPFFTTKQVGKGTGLGLAISYQIIQKHGGQIDVISQGGQGTEFTIEIPICKAKAKGVSVD